MFVPAIVYVNLISEKRQSAKGFYRRGGLVGGSAPQTGLFMQMKNFFMAIGKQQGFIYLFVEAFAFNSQRILKERWPSWRVSSTDRLIHADLGGDEELLYGHHLYQR